MKYLKVIDKYQQNEPFKTNLYQKFGRTWIRVWTLTFYGDAWEV